MSNLKLDLDLKWTEIYIYLPKEENNFIYRYHRNTGYYFNYECKKDYLPPPSLEDPKNIGITLTEIKQILNK